MAEIIVLSVSHALFTEGFEAKLSIRHFAEVYSARNGADDWMNIFIAEDYGRLNPSHELCGRSSVAPNPDRTVLHVL
jgi:hypothetical protein